MDVADLKALIDAYGVAVRAGLVTPQSQDEIFIRQKFELPEMSPEVSAAWADVGNVKQPITLAKDLADHDAGKDEGSEND